MVLITVAALVIGGAVILLNRPSTPTTAGGDLIGPPAIYSADIVSGQSLGRADAPVVLSVWSDFQCPVCGRFVRDQYANLKATFIDTGVLRIESHDIAILGSGDPDESLELAVGARCASEQGRYWQYHDLIFWNHGRENRGDYGPEFLAAVANRAGVDRSAWDSCVAADTVRDAVMAETVAAVREGINSTPTLSLNG
ncbi:MAG: thioredoxin domain-containing protein, partial [Candidatus Limnocylindrales bacterium]